MMNIETYKKLYGFDFDFKYEHLFDSFRINNKNLCYQLFFTPNECKGTFVIMHGYFDHSGLLSGIIEFFLKNGYNAAVYDMPGHGLSEGEKASINDFTEYLNAMIKFSSIVKEKINCGPYYVAAHSTGCCPVMESVLKKIKLFDKIFLAAPLIRSSNWKLSKSLFNICYPLKKYKLIKNLKRKFCVNSSCEKYLELRKSDPLQHDRVSLRWYYSLLKWNNRMIRYKHSEDSNIFIMQGDSDVTLDWKYNLNFLNEKFPNADIFMIKGANHQLFNESKEYLDKVCSYILKRLEE